VRRLPARTSYPALVGVRGRKSQQFGQSARSGVVHGRSHRHLDGFQIETPGLAPATKNDPQQLIYFARDFLADRLRCFFS
jgi:hypothetical protein